MKRLLALWMLVLLAACGSVSETPPEPQQSSAQFKFNPCSIMFCGWTSVGSSLNTSTASRAMWPDLALDPAGFPVVSFVDGAVSDYIGSLYVKHWNGTAWIPFGGAIDSINTTWSYPPILTLDQAGLPVVAYWHHYTASSPSDVISVKRWNGSSWTALPPVPCALPEGFGDLALDLNGQPVFACNNYNPSNQVGYLEFFLFNGNAWVKTFNNIPQAKQPKLAVDASNRLVVGFKQTSLGTLLQAMRTLGSTWQDLGAVGLNASGAFDFGLDGTGNPVFAAFQKTGTQTQMVVKQLSSTGFVALGNPIDYAFKDWALSLAVTGNQIAVSFFGDDNLVRVQKYNAASNAWNAVGDTVNTTPNLIFDAHADPKIALKANGTPVVAWQEYLSSSPRYVYVKEFGGGRVPPILTRQ